MTHFRLALGVVAFLGLLSCGHGQERLRPAEKEEPKEREKGGPPAEATAFPRVDGVYRVQRLTDLVNHENVNVYDYLAFSKGGAVYHIPGGFVPPNEYGLEAPSRAIPGGWDHFSVAIKNQPEYIRKWLDNPNWTPPLNWRYELNAGAATTTTKPSAREQNTWTAEATPNGLKVKLTRKLDGAVVQQKEVLYEFVPFR